MKNLLCILILCVIHSWVLAQNLVKIDVLDKDVTVPLIFLKVYPDSLSLQTDVNGHLEFLTNSKKIRVVHDGNLGFEAFDNTYNVTENKLIKIQLKVHVNVLDDATIDITKKTETEGTSVVTITKAVAKVSPTPFPDIKGVLSFLGARTADELSTEYAVRGGNYNENSVYVNGIPIYKSFLAKSGQQQGLSFVNLDLIEKVDFYSGGWDARFGGKLSSVLDVKYKKPTSFGGSFSPGILSSTAHLESNFKKGYFLIGGRYKSSKYLLKTLETEGEYFPKFGDVQLLYHYDLKKDSQGEKTSIEFLGNYAANRFSVEPTRRNTSFGTADQIVNLSIAFDGIESMNYDSYQGGLKLTHKISSRHITNFIVSGLYTAENEFQNLEAGYLFCDVAGMSEEEGVTKREQCLTEKGMGTLFNYSRNFLDAKVTNVLYESIYELDSSAVLRWGGQYGYEFIEDQVNEYSFKDSSDYVKIIDYESTNNLLKSHRANGFVQIKKSLSKKQSLSAGVRASWWSMNKQFLLAPRISYLNKQKTRKGKDLIYKAAIGIYHQPPFYRELKNLEGEINRDIKAQSSAQFIVGRNQSITLWGRPFFLNTELYTKYLWNVNPYDVDNIRIRYHGNNDAKAYVFGTDLRFSGEFIKGEESWFTLSYLNTKEDIAGDNQGYVRRPSDQRILFGAFFQDHFPNNPTFKVHLNLVYGSGIPYGPPNDLKNRTAVVSPAYRRVDIGFSKMIMFRDREVFKKTWIESLWISLDVLNIAGVNNTISYVWIEDFENHKYAVPNTLSARFLNLRAILKF